MGEGELGHQVTGDTGVAVGEETEDGDACGVTDGLGHCGEGVVVWCSDGLGRGVGRDTGRLVSRRRVVGDLRWLGQDRDPEVSAGAPDQAVIAPSMRYSWPLQ